MTRRPLPLLLVALLLLSSLAPLASAGEAWTKETGSAITAVATDERGDRIFVGTESGMVYCYDASGNVVWTWNGAGGGSVAQIVSSNSGDLIAVVAQSPHRVSLLDGVTGAPKQSSSAGDYCFRTAMTRDGGLRVDHYASLGGNRGLLRFSSVKNHNAFRWDPSIPGLSPHDVVISGSGDWVVSGSSDSTTKLRLFAVDFHEPGEDWVAGPQIFRKKLTISNSGSTDLTDPIFRIIAVPGAGTDSGNLVYLDPYWSSALPGVVFTASDGVTRIPTGRSQNTFAVKYPGTIHAGGTASIYIYWFAPWHSETYDNLYFLTDDFEDGVIDSSLWTTVTYGSGTVTETSGYLDLNAPPTAPGSLARFTGKQTYSTPVHVKMNISFPSTYLGSTLNRNSFFGLPETFSSQYTGGDGTLDLMVNQSQVLADNIVREPPQQFEVWFCPNEPLIIRYGSDWNGSVPYSFTTLSLTGVAGQGVNNVRGHFRIHDITVEPWYDYFESTLSYSWSAREHQIVPVGEKTFSGDIVHVAAAEQGDWIVIQTATNIYLQEVSPTGFGTVYSADRTGTPYAVAIANNGANTIEGRGILADIFRFDGVQTGTYTAGGPVRAVAIAQKNGLYAAAGSDDGKYYIFSKDESSSWYLLHASDSASPVTAIAMSWRGEIAVIGRADGSVVLYTTTDAPPPDSQMTVYIIKDGQPYIGKPVSVSTADVSDPDKWTPLYSSLRTDSDGKIVISTHTGHYYQININNGEKIVVIQASSATAIYSVVFRSPLIYEKYNYDVQYNASSQAIEMAYTDNEGPATISWSIVRTDTYSEVFSHTTSGVTAATATYPISEPDVSYKVTVKVQRSSGSIQNTWFITPQNASPIALPFWDENIQNAVFIIFLMILGGIFYYSTGAKGALIVALVAALFRYFDWITVPWFWVIAAVVFAFLANIAEGA